MPATEKLTGERRTQLEEDLTHYATSLDRIKGLKDIGHRYNDLGIIIYAMKGLRLRSYLGWSYGELKQLEEYIGRMFFHRRLTVRAQDFQYSGAIGLDKTGGTRYRLDMLPVIPSCLILEFRLEGLDGRKVLVCKVSTWTDWTRKNHLNRDELVISLGMVEGRFHSRATEVTMHYRNPAVDVDPGPPTCWMCGDYRCKRFVHLPVKDVETAYQNFGPAYVWRVLDGFWGNDAARRPMRRPLSQRSLRIRTLVHKGQVVKIITAKDSYFGVLKEVFTNADGGINAVKAARELWEPFGNSLWPVEIPAGDILEILPKREYRDSTFGMISYL